MKIALAGVISKPITKEVTGGAEMFTYLLVEELVSLGHSVTLYCAEGSHTAAQKHVFICHSEEAIAEASRIELVYPYTLIEMRTILEDISKNQYDILHISFLKNFFAAFFADQVAIPMVYTMHRDILSNPLLSDVYKKIGFHPHEHIVFPSKSSSERSLIHHNAHVIHHGINTNLYPFTSSCDQCSYIWFSRIDPVKGIVDAMKACALAHVPLITSGAIDKPKQQEYFDREVRPLLSSTISYDSSLSFQKKIALFQQGKALVLPLQEEPFGLVAIEAMSCGTPVIAYDNGAMGEIIEEGQTGFLVSEKKGVDGLVEAIQKMQSLSPKAYMNMRKSCRKRVEEQFSSSRMVLAYQSLYQQIQKAS